MHLRGALTAKLQSSNFKLALIPKSLRFSRMRTSTMRLGFLDDHRHLRPCCDCSPGTHCGEPRRDPPAGEPVARHLQPSFWSWRSCCAVFHGKPLSNSWHIRELTCLTLMKKLSDGHCMPMRDTGEVRDRRQNSILVIFPTVWLKPTIDHFFSLARTSSTRMCRSHSKRVSTTSHFLVVVSACFLWRRAPGVIQSD